MSVVRRPLNPNPVPSQSPNPYPVSSQGIQYQNTATQNVQPVPNIITDVDPNNVTWFKVGSTARKINPDETVMFIPLSDIRETKNGTGIISAYVIEWKDKNGQTIFDHVVMDIFMQTVLVRKVRDAITFYGSRFGINNIRIKVHNKGRPPGKRYYDFDVEVGVSRNVQ
jgi:hypothetical protein